jgi:hypothetical protein
LSDVLRWFILVVVVLLDPGAVLLLAAPSNTTGVRAHRA